MKYDLILSGRFKKSLKIARKRGLNLDILNSVVDKLINGIPLDDKYRDHQLQGAYKGCRECHLTPDWLLIYIVKNNTLTLTLLDTGTHADLFGK